MYQSTVWFPSKVDWWIVPLLAVPPVTGILIAVSALNRGDIVTVAISLGALGLVGLIYAGLIFPMRYGVTDKFLIVRFGWCRQRIPLEQIQEVRPSRNPLSSHALSLDRLHVRYGDRFYQQILISPADRRGFYSALTRQSQLVPSGQSLALPRQ